MSITLEPDYTARIKIVKVQEGENYENESIVPSDFDWDFFNEVAGRQYGGGTTRWMQVPKLYIIDGPLEGYTGFETPTQEEIDQVIQTWKEEIKKLSNGFIDISDENIYIGHDVNDPTFKEAVKQMVNGAVLSYNGWNVTLWTNMLPGSGDHGETVESGVIKSARQRYRPGASKGIIEIESSQSIGFPVDPADDSKRWKPGHMENGFTDLYYKCGELNYSRPPNTMSQDISN